MILLADIGNSRVKWAWMDANGLGPAEAASHRDKNLDELWPELWRGMPAPKRILAANVAGDAIAHSLTSWCRRHWGSEVEFAAVSAAAGGVRNGYSEPARLGVDRWLALIGARTLVDLPCCVVDCGTALTVDAVDSDGAHLGGWIVPGLQMMTSLLRSGTSGVQVDHFAGESLRGFGRNTAAAVAGGAAHAASGLVRQALGLLQQQAGSAVACVVTGGDASLLLPLLPAPCRHSPELVLLGLAALIRDEGKGNPG